MTESQDEHLFTLLAQRIVPHGSLRRTWCLTGGVSAQVTALRVERPDGRTATFVVRQYGAEDRKRNPRIARDEFALLRVCHDRGLPVPTPYIVDESCDLLPSPFIVVGYVDGATKFEPPGVSGYAGRVAALLASIHRAAPAPELTFLPTLDRGFDARPDILDDSLSETRIRRALESAWPLPHANDSALLHGDFWPGNILWRDGEIVAIIDWEDAAIGDPLADVANCRLEILWAFGVDTMNEFTSQYQSMTAISFANVPYWDLRVALRPCSRLSNWGLDAATERRMRERHKLFVDQALAALPG